MIIMGYPGVGKTTTARDDYRFIDLDSSLWKPVKDWSKYYCQLAEELSAQGYFVFVSTHPEVKNRLLSSREKTCICYPAMELKDKWIAKLHARYKDLPNSKTHNAWKRAVDHFDEDIPYMDNLGYRKIELQSMDYNLKQLIVNLYDAPVW